MVPCDRCGKPCKGKRGLAAHKRSCNGTAGETAATSAAAAASASTIDVDGEGTALTTTKRQQLS